MNDPTNQPDDDWVIPEEGAPWEEAAQEPAPTPTSETATEPTTAPQSMAEMAEAIFPQQDPLPPSSPTAPRPTEATSDATSQTLPEEAIAQIVSSVRRDLTQTIEGFRDQLSQIKTAAEIIPHSLKHQTDQAASQIETTAAEAIHSLSRIQEELDATIAASQSRMKTTAAAAEKLTTRFDTASSRLYMKMFIAPAITAVLTIILVVAGLSTIRPGWFLTPDQHEAVYIGAQVIRDFRTATPEKRAEMIRILNWRSDSELRPIVTP